MTVSPLPEPLRAEVADLLASMLLDDLERDKDISVPLPEPESTGSIGTGCARGPRKPAMGQRSDEEAEAL
jgi:hypothetical protein